MHPITTSGVGPAHGRGLRWLCGWGAALLLSLHATEHVQANVHKDTRRGFQIKAPKNFEPIALKPGQINPVAQWQDPKREFGTGAESNTYYHPDLELHAYSMQAVTANERSLETFLEEQWERCETWLGYGDVEKEKSIRVAGSEGVEKTIVFESNGITMYFAMVPFDDYVFLLRGSAFSVRFKNHASDFSGAARSLTRIAKEDTSARDADREQMDSDERRLQSVIDQLPAGWDSMRTDRYLFVFNADKNLVKELGKQIEAIRDVYEKIYPPDRPIEDVSIVRVCKDRSTYSGYGGSPNAGGHWSSFLRELVIFDEPPTSETVAVLNHEAFHQYIYYFYGELSPHSWYNEGTGDYFAGAKMTRTYRISGFGDAPGGFGRQDSVKWAVRETRSGREGITHLRDLMRFSQAEYYANAQIHYAQGWALIHWLRETKRLPDRWASILDDYLEALLAARHEVATKVMNKALEMAEQDEEGSSAEMSKDPKDYYGLADTNEIQRRAYDIQFESWTEADWDAFNAAYMDYVDSL